MGLDTRRWAGLSGGKPIRLSAEERFLLACCGDPQSCAPGADGSGLRWQVLRQRLREYPFASSAGLLWPTLGPAGSVRTVPEDVRLDIETVYRDNAAYNRVLLAELIDVLGALTRAGIETVVSKGTALLLDLYKDLGLRRSADVDLLVRREQAAAAERCLRSRGYLSERRHEARRDWYLRSHHHLPPLGRIRDSKVICIEIQWHTSRHPRAPVLTEHLWNASRSTNASGMPIRIPAPEHLFLHAVLDIWSHNFLKGIRPFCDLRLLALRPESHLVWRNVESEAGAIGIQTETAAVLNVMDLLWGPGMPALSSPASSDLAVPEKFPAAAAECTMHQAPDHIAVLHLLAMLLPGGGPASARQALFPTEFSSALRDARSPAEWLRKTAQQIRRILQVLPHFRATWGNERARAVVDHWIARLAEIRLAGP